MDIFFVPKMYIHTSPLLTTAPNLISNPIDITNYIYRFIKKKRASLQIYDTLIFLPFKFDLLIAIHNFI